MEKNLIIEGYNQRKLRRALLLDKCIKLFLPTRKRVRPIPSQPNSILVIQSHLIGDLIMAIPMLKTLRNKFPNAKIILLANEFAADLLKGVAFVDEIITVKFPWATYDYSLSNLLNLLKHILHLRRRKCDLAIDAQIDMRNAILMFLIGAKNRLGYAVTGGGSFLTHIAQFPEEMGNLLEARLSILKYLGITEFDQTTMLPVGKDPLTKAKSFLEEHKIDRKKLVVIHPGASKKEKRWSSTKFSEVIAFLEERGMTVVILEGPEDRKIVSEIQEKVANPIICFEGRLRDVTAFMSQCRLLICLDSAAIHLAGATGTAALAIYGPKWPLLTRPSADNIKVIWNEKLDCRPCEYGHCKQKTILCMESITSSDVINKIEECFKIYP